MRRLRLCGGIMVFDGVVLVAVAAIHLLVIPVLKRVVTEELTAGDMAWVWPPFLLNHAVVGVLLIPLGVSTIYAGVHLARRERWAHRIAVLNALTAMCLPVVLVVVMPGHYFHAKPFLIAAILVCVAAASMIGPLLWVAGEFGATDGEREAG